MERRIVAIALLTKEEFDLLGGSFARAWPVSEAHHFDGLLGAIDDAERRLEGGRGQGPGTGPRDRHEEQS